MKKSYQLSCVIYISSLLRIFNFFYAVRSFHHCHKSTITLIFSSFFLASRCHFINSAAECFTISLLILSIPSISLTWADLVDDERRSGGGGGGGSNVNSRVSTNPPISPEEDVTTICEGSFNTSNPSQCLCPETNSTSPVSSTRRYIRAHCRVGWATTLMPHKRLKSKPF